MSNSNPNNPGDPRRQPPASNTGQQPTSYILPLPRPSAPPGPPANIFPFPPILNAARQPPAYNLPFAPTNAAPGPPANQFPPNNAAPMYPSPYPPNNAGPVSTFTYPYQTNNAGSGSSGYNAPTARGDAPITRGQETLGRPRQRRNHGQPDGLPLAEKIWDFRAEFIVIARHREGKTVAEIWREICSMGYSVTVSVLETLIARGVQEGGSSE